MQGYNTKDYGKVFRASEVSEAFGFSERYLRDNGKKLGLESYMVSVSAGEVGGAKGKILCITMDGMRAFKKTPSAKYRASIGGDEVVEEQLIEHFKKEYEEKRGVKYITQLKDLGYAGELLNYFGTIERAKEYMGWFIDNTRADIASLKYLVFPAKMMEFVPAVEKAKRDKFPPVKRDEKIPDDLVLRIWDEVPDFFKVQTLKMWSELSFIALAIKTYGAENMPIETEALKIAVEMGYLEDIDKPRELIL